MAAAAAEADLARAKGEQEVEEHGESDEKKAGEQKLGDEFVSLMFEESEDEAEEEDEEDGDEGEDEEMVEQGDDNAEGEDDEQDVDFLLSEDNGELAASGAPTSSRRRTVDRRSARKSKREVAKTKKTQFFLKHKDEPARPPNVKKRVATTVDEERPAKRPKLKEEPAILPAALKPSSPRPKSAPMSALPTKLKPKSKLAQTPLDRLASKQSISQAQSRKKQKDVEDDEIAWLEAKLGIGAKKKGKGKGVYGTAFSADGLDDILMDLDRLEEDIDGFGGGEGEDASGSSEDEEDSEEEGGGEDEDESEGGNEGEQDEELAEGENDTEDASGDEESFEVASDEEDVPTLIEHKSPEPAKAAGAYVPPHLRQKATSSDSTTITQTPEQVKLARQLKGLLNRLSEQNIQGIVTETEGLYRSNPRNDVTQALTRILLDSISSSANLLDTFVILHAAFIAALHKIIGIEFGEFFFKAFSAYFAEQTVSSYETHWKALRSDSKPADQSTADNENTSAPTGTKESSNLLVLLSELYNFQVISCMLIYDLIRALLNSEFLEHDVELLLKVVKNSGHQMRQDDPLALKDIVQLVQDKMRGKNPNELSSRFRFMVETLINLKNNRLKDTKRLTGTGQTVASEAIERMKKYLSGINRKRHVMSHEPLRVSLDDLHSSTQRGKWWLVGSAWGGDSLVEKQDATAESKKKEAGSKVKATMAEQLVQLARRHGMNTEIRRNIFVVLVSSDDYVDACERLTQLELQETQQREIIRVVLHCCGNERTYNPFYTLVAHHLCQKSHSHRITLQYCLWDFLRSLGETQVGGAAISRDFDTNGEEVSDSTISNYAKAYAWWLARGSVTLTVFKPIEFLVLQPRSKQFLKLVFLQMIISSQSSSPLVDVRSAESVIPQTRNRAAIEEIVSKGLRIPTMCKGIAYFIQSLRSEEIFGARTKRAHDLLVWGLDVAKEALQRDSLSDDDL
ncbi:suppressor of glycerol defect [Ceratobasidium sp. 392]|nr:suppressor of glycerol defect [Ceratobasidium sp. 392]